MSKIKQLTNTIRKFAECDLDYGTLKTLKMIDDEVDKIEATKSPTPLGQTELALLSAMAFYLANDGSHGIFDAMELYKAKKQVVALIGEPAIKAKQHRPF